VLRPPSSIRVALSHPSSTRAIPAMFCKFRLRSFLLLTLFQPHPRASTVLIYKLDAGHFKRTTDRLERRATWFACTCFELMHGHYPYLSELCEVLLAPFQETASCPAL
jgi:hypothetical protein